MSNVLEEADIGDFDFDDLLEDNVHDQQHEENEQEDNARDQEQEDQEDEGSEQNDSDIDFIVDEDNAMVDPEVDMTDYRLNIDLEVEDNMVGNNHQDVDLGDEVLDNDKFQSGSDSNDVQTNIRRHHLRTIRMEHENLVNLYLGQVFSTKQEIKKLIKKYVVENTRCIKIVKDDNTRVRAVCHGMLPDFEVDDSGVHIDTQRSRRGKEKVADVQSKGKGKEKVAGVQGKGKGKGKGNIKGSKVNKKDKGGGRK
ncbi:uncharacterized protein LOC110931217 [Helianthus annuus]|uniref:uncharacterized protein LOC110931217 n=1 Tax=Helianthus annuus TaxID=4232 RepID=UPI000B8EF0E6|nr:uncharacterized protein LOC110931217 [Helianthus annuus]